MGVVITGEVTRTQYDFFRNDTGALWAAFLGGWGAGKTWIGGRKAVELALANPGRNGLIVAPFWNTIHRVTLAAFLEACPKGLVLGVDSKAKAVKLRGGGRVFFGSADRPETLDGPTVAWEWIDEARYVKRQGWRVGLSRLRDGKASKLRGIITSTPGGEWLAEEFNAQDPNRVAFHASTRQNAHNLARGYIESLETSLSPRAAKVFIDGQFGLLEGVVYPEWDPGWHLIPWTYQPGLRTMAAVDFGYQRPAVLFLQQIPSGTSLPPPAGMTHPRVALPGTWVVFDELVPEGITTELLAAQIKAKRYVLDGIWCDPAGDGAQVALGVSDVQILRSHGWDVRFFTQPRLRHIPFGVGVLQAMLRNVRGETRLYAARSLVRPGQKRGFAKDVTMYRYPETKDGKRIVDEPLKDGVTDHTMDAARYFAVGEALSSGTFPEHIAAG